MKDLLQEPVYVPEDIEGYKYVGSSFLKDGNDALKSFSKMYPGFHLMYVESEHPVKSVLWDVYQKVLL